ncbi:alpha-N-acetyl-neuraminyl-2,3-beta-galactosyl-1,3-N-acetyl-galactosaminide alpha-2,6-sialyltransferase isoform X3 [Prionailurus viverrinus]|uniref:alpha-N-acetyl-neuraminyl-2,3-beta-galactosyl-1, 3-N-acetyl-galactosaminide alpha-2,6-sialyltransferase isoform X3 n=1 Tax=Prionailurus viverrinus TaxID=61388 RepID=UPI001FF4214D|nr:alpha-N-acetyl-neuraminyl-2,3-beta-galactosyl-1,3-N-acetyl-galactosaminide alpha-2,6-sialyltransferase isoform X3 [Prionailurus viverrinus]
MKAPGRLLLVILCSSGFSAAYILLCCWACLSFCLAPCLDPHPSTNSRPTVPGPLHFSGYSSVPDGKPLVREPCRSCAVVSSSGQMLGSGLGAEIDSAECVLRMNQAPTVGFEADVGRRSTLRVVSHTSVPLLLRNYSHYFQHARDTLYVVWGQGRHMDRALGGRTYRTLLQLTKMYPGLQVYTFTERMMAYCDQVFQDETGKNRSGWDVTSSEKPSMTTPRLKETVRLLPQHRLVHHDPRPGAVRGDRGLRNGQRQLLQGGEPPLGALPLL